MQATTATFLFIELVRCYLRDLIVSITELEGEQGCLW